MEPRLREAFAGALATLRPFLNRLVFYGVDTCRAELDRNTAVRSPTFPLRELHALTTGQLSRLAPELNAAGLQRQSRTPAGERWVASGTLLLTLESAAEATGDDAATGILEYATLLTTTAKLDSGETVRVCSLPAQIALIWRAHVRSGADFSASAWTEDLVELVVRRHQILDDVATLPPELRAAIARAAATFAGSDAALWTLEHALPEARTAPGLADEALKRFHQLAALAA